MTRARWLNDGDRIPNRLLFVFFLFFSFFFSAYADAAEFHGEKKARHASELRRGRPAVRARDTTAPVSFPGLIFPLEIFLRTRSRRRSYHNSDVARRLFHLFRRGASRDAVSRAQRFLAYSGEIRERVGVKIALASGDNALRAFPFDIGAL